MPPIFRWLGIGLLAVVLLLLADQPRASRVLLLDLARSDPALLDQTAQPWRDVGYRVEYRRFFPHLTRRDLDRYRTVIILGGGEPAHRSDALTLGDLALLTELTRRAGVAVLGYHAAGARSRDEASAGALDRWSMNRWLAALGTGIRIGERPLADTSGGTRGWPRADVPVLPQPRSALDNAGFAAFPAGSSHPLTIRDPRQALARASAGAFVSARGGGAAPRGRAAVVAASRVGPGLVVVASRQALASGQHPGGGAATFFEALALWTRRPAEWAGVASTRVGHAFSLRGAPRPIATDAPRLAPPPGAEVLRLPLPLTDIPPPTPPAWISRQGMRVLWADFASWPRPSAIDSILVFTDAAALNALATAVLPAALAESLPPPPSRRGVPRGVRTPWQLAAEQLGATSLRWFPAIALASLPAEAAEEVDIRGALAGLPCALDSTYWLGTLRPALRGLTRLGGARPETITGIAIQLDPPAGGYRGMGFCDPDYRAGLARLPLDAPVRERLLLLPPVARHDTLLHLGLLGGYYAALEEAVGERAAALRAELRRLHPDLRFAFRTTRAPTDWFSLGLLRGFSTNELPVFLWFEEPQDRRLLARYRARHVTALSAVQLDPRRVPLDQWRRLGPLAFGQHHGFWLPAAGADTVGRVIRRLMK